MTMQDKIQEIMRLVDAYDVESRLNASTNPSCYELSSEEKEDAAYRAIETKLRELVREPLDEESIERVTGVKRGTPMFLAATGFVRATERAHGITNASGVE